MLMVVLKRQSKIGNVLIRSENGLGEGILITCQHDKEMKNQILMDHCH